MCSQCPCPVEMKEGLCWHELGIPMICREVLGKQMEAWKSKKSTQGTYLHSRYVIVAPCSVFYRDKMTFKVIRNQNVQAAFAFT